MYIYIDNMYIYIYNMYPTANAKTCKLANPDSTFLPSHLNPKSIYSIFRRIRLSLKSWIGFVWAELEFQPDSRVGVVSLGKFPCSCVENWEGKLTKGKEQRGMGKQICVISFYTLTWRTKNCNKLLSPPRVKGPFWEKHLEFQHYWTASIASAASGLNLSLSSSFLIHFKTTYSGFFFNNSQKFCHLSLAGTRLLLVVQKITSQ